MKGSPISEKKNLHLVQEYLLSQEKIFSVQMSPTLYLETSTNSAHAEKFQSNMYDRNFTLYLVLQLHKYL